MIFAVGTVIDLARQRLEHRVLDPFLERVSLGDDMDGGMSVKTIRENYETSVFRSRGVWLFCVFFLMYVFLGLCISWQTAFNTNIFFGADNTRAFQDMTLIIMDDPSGHYRIAVHPLFLLLAQTPVLLVNGVVNRPEMSVILVEACCGALSVCLFDGILGRKGVERRIQTAFTLIYGCSFSMMIFSTVPETFIFAGLGLVSFWYFLALAGEKKGPLSGREKLLAVFFGIVSIGVTLTNYVFYLVGLIYLLLLRYGFKSGAKEFFKLNVFNGGGVIVACLYQRFVWKQAPLFWISIINAFLGQPYEETRYMNWECSLAKTATWLKETVFRPLLAPAIYLTNPGQSYHPTGFSGYGATLKAVLILFWATAAVCLAFHLAARLKDRFDLERDGYLLGLLAAFAGNLALHYIYGYDEAFMYSPHYLFYILLAVPLALKRGLTPPPRGVLIPGLLAFWVIEVLNNLSRFFQAAQVALDTIGSSVNITHSVKGTVMCGVFLLAALLCWDRLRPWGGAPSQKKDAEFTTRGLRSFVLVYGAAVLVISLFVAFNY